MLIPGKLHSLDESRNYRVSIQTLDFARVRTFTLCDRSWIAGVGAITGRTPRRSRPMTGPHRRLRTIDIACSARPKRPGGGYGRSATVEAQRPSAPGRLAGESPPPPVGCCWTIGRRRGWDGRVKRRAAAGSPAPWRTCQKADVPRDGGKRSPTGCLIWETTGPPSDVAGRSADIAGGRHI